MEPSQSLTTSSATHIFVNLLIYDERKTTFTTAEILSGAAVTSKWCVQWGHANTYDKLLDTLTSLVGFDARGFRISVHTEEGYQLHQTSWGSYVNLLPTIQILILDPKPQAPKGQSMLFIASIVELNIRFGVLLEPGTDMIELHRAIVTKARQLLPTQSGHRNLSCLRVLCEGVLCYPVTRGSVRDVGSLQAHVLECRPVWMDM